MSSGTRRGISPLPAPRGTNPAAVAVTGHTRSGPPARLARCHCRHAESGQWPFSSPVVRGTPCPWTGSTGTGCAIRVEPPPSARRHVRKGDVPIPEHDRAQHETAAPPAVARFYDTLRSGSLSTAALVHGDADIGQECLLTPAEILDFACRAGITAGTFVLDIGSGTGGPVCYLAQQLGCRILGVDLAAVGHAQARACPGGGTQPSRTVSVWDIAALPLPEATFDVILGLDAWCHIPQRARLIQRCATLLRPQGRIAFYDHVVCQPLPAEAYQHFVRCGGFRGLRPRRATVRHCRGRVPHPGPRCHFGVCGALLHPPASALYGTTDGV